MARPQKYTQEILAQIPEMVKSGMPEAEIAARFDSTVPSLRVTCVKHKISLKQEDYVDELKFRQLSYPVELTMAERVKLLDYARVHGLRGYELIEQIVRAVLNDSLFDAILEPEKT